MHLWSTIELHYTPQIMPDSTSYGIQASAPDGYELRDWHPHPVDGTKIIVCWRPIGEAAKPLKIPEQALTLITDAVQRWARKHLE